ncbi:putative ATP-dependent RNA helicase DDX20 [Petromyzon marinus]|uniref:putative ATP-dependent RNA helicase DDX20 n=1 Tax=Petromyzon marinus TaxID=7757 RepID=UPI003F6FC94C
MKLGPAHSLGSSRRRTRDALGVRGAGDPGGGPSPPPPASFSALLLSGRVLAGLSAAGFSAPSPIQLKAIPLARCGLDLVVQAKSGTGKTCVFTTVALEALVSENLAVQVLVLAPTREIAVQIHSVMLAIGAHVEGLQCHVFIGGTPLSLDQQRLRKCHIAIGSPGRVKQLIELGHLSVGAVRLFVLDEADKLLEQGSFQEQINWIYSSLPANKQVLALSATYPESLASHLTHYMREPTYVRLNPSDMALLGLKQFYKVVPCHPISHHILRDKTQELLQLLSRIPFNQALVFSNMHSRAQHLADSLSARGFPAACISGGMTQSQRLDAMSKLKHFQCRVLISTDLMARGIDAEKVNLVINLDVPDDWETYMHRVGRAGRFGTYGVVVTYCSQGEEENLLMKIAAKCNLQLQALPETISSDFMAEAFADQEEDAPGDLPVAAVVQPPAWPSSRSSLATHKARPQVPAQRVRVEHSGKAPARKQHKGGAPNPAGPWEEDEPGCRRVSVGGSSEAARPAQAATEVRVAENGGGGSGCLSWQPASLHPLPPNRLREAGSSSESILPQVPPLALFKRSSSTQSRNFAEALADYEYFLCHGVGKPPEAGTAVGDGGVGGAEKRPTSRGESDPQQSDSCEPACAGGTEGSAAPRSAGGKSDDDEKSVGTHVRGHSEREVEREEEREEESSDEEMDDADEEEGSTDTMDSEVREASGDDAAPSQRHDDPRLERTAVRGEGAASGIRAERAERRLGADAAARAGGATAGRAAGGSHLDYNSYFFPKNEAKGRPLPSTPKRDVKRDAFPSSTTRPALKQKAAAERDAASAQPRTREARPRAAVGYRAAAGAADGAWPAGATEGAWPAGDDADPYGPYAAYAAGGGWSAWYRHYWQWWYYANAVYTRELVKRC